QKDPIYAARVKAWLGDPKKLLDWRHTMARCQALADMLEGRVRVVGLRNGAELPPPLLAAIDELRQRHLAIGKLEHQSNATEYVHLSLVDWVVTNTATVLSEFVEPTRVGVALDKLYALRRAVRPDLAGAPVATGDDEDGPPMS